MNRSKSETSGIGKVYLVGAGPGDPGLFTLKGKSCLEIADVVLYDRLANPELLHYMRPDAERIYVGKRQGQHPLTQGAIAQILVDRATQGNIVVRLKGGDPFIFGRGGEEAQALVDAGIPYEIVPGVSSAIAVPAYAGIPLTHREHASSVAFVTGHQSPDGDGRDVDWARVAAGADTLVILMGLGRLAEIAAVLIQAGRPAETPACVIEWGTLPAQRTVVAPLNEIAAHVSEASLQSPGIIIVGEVVSLHEILAWFSPSA